MRYAVSHVSIIGYIWMPNTLAALDVTLSEHDIENMRGEDGTITRAGLEDWIGSHSGDFQVVSDFSATIEDGESTLDFPWAAEESEIAYSDCMFGGEE